MGDESEYLDDSGYEYAMQDYQVDTIDFVQSLSNDELVSRIHMHIRSYSIFKVNVRDLISKYQKGGYQLTPKQRSFLEKAYLYINYDIGGE